MPENIIMIDQITKIILISLAVERITEIIVASVLFAPIRDYFRSKNIIDSSGYSIWWFLDSVLQCGYCMSVWVSASLAWVSPYEFTEHAIINIFVSIFVIHGLANLYHVAYEFARRGRVLHHDININYKKNIDG
jgi:hypothetical protein